MLVELVLWVVPQSDRNGRTGAVLPAGLGYFFFPTLTGFGVVGRVGAIGVNVGGIGALGGAAVRSERSNGCGSASWVGLLLLSHAYRVRRRRAGWRNWRECWWNWCFGWCRSQIGTVERVRFCQLGWVTSSFPRLQGSASSGGLAQLA